MGKTKVWTVREKQKISENEEVEILYEYDEQEKTINHILLSKTPNVEDEVFGMTWDVYIKEEEHFKEYTDKISLLLKHHLDLRKYLSENIDLSVDLFII